MSAFDAVVALAVGYLLGGLPSAALAARARGRSIFRVGSGNMGAMNVTRNLGAAWGIAVLAADVGKGALAAGAGAGMATLLGGGADARLALALLAGIGAVTGHAWSPYVGFRGGKALATAFGAALPVAPWAALATLTLLIALVLLTRRVGVATVLTLLLYPVTTYLATHRASGDQGLAFATATAAVVVAILVLVKHVAAWRRERRRAA